MDAHNAECVLDLLSAWQSLHALLPQHLRVETDDLNRQTIEVLERCAAEARLREVLERQEAALVECDLEQAHIDGKVS